MNHARQLYLATYGVIDTLDQAIKSSRLYYCSWKYWHSPMLHGKAMIWAIAYSMYEECAEGMLNLDWKVPNKVDFWTFRDVGADQLLSYNPVKRKYLGDKMMRVATSQNTKLRRNRAVMWPVSSASFPEMDCSKSANHMLQTKRNRHRHYYPRHQQKEEHLSKVMTASPILTPLPMLTTSDRPSSPLSSLPQPPKLSFGSLPFMRSLNRVAK